MANVLVVEDLDDSFTLIREALDADHSLDRAKSIAEAQAVFDKKKYDLALVDIGLPDGDGYQFCYWIRNKIKNMRIPIIFISAKTTVENRITGFTVGGDDYIFKPINFMELKLRVDAKLKRAKQEADPVINFYGICANAKSQRVQVLSNTETLDLDLTPIEFKILYAFLSEPEKVFSRDELLNKVWGENIFVFPRSVDTHVSKLRKKLGPKSHYIKSIHGMGYRLSHEGAPDQEEHHSNLHQPEGDDIVHLAK